MTNTLVPLYNSLPTLGNADERFIDRDTIFQELIDLFAEFDFKWGLCLVHAHCKLAEGEIMLATGNVSKPTNSPASGQVYYPERWLSSGIAYEFTTEPTETPPSRLLREFNLLTKRNPVLGLYYSGGQGMTDGFVLLEHTEGRDNITIPTNVQDLSPDCVQTAWLPGSANPVQMACAIYCDTIVTRYGQVKHKNTQTHIEVK